MADPLVLRDIHPSMAPSWWPPAPGWWVLAALAVLVLAALIARRVARVRRRRRLAKQFDAEVGAAARPADAVAAMSSLLRRAGRLRDPAADRLEGEEWIAFLDDGRAAPRFAGSRGALLLEGPFRPVVDPADVDDLRTVARARFIEWMEGRA